MPEKITVHEMTPDDLINLVEQLFDRKFQSVSDELQRIVGEDDLISTGTACRLLGVCSKVLKVLVDQGQFTVYHHLKERRYIRGEILEYRNKYRVNKKRG